MNMLERIAKALKQSELERGLCSEEFSWKNYLPDARAAISAMREPTDAMLESVSSFVDIRHIDQDPEYYWTRMADAALEE